IFTTDNTVQGGIRVADEFMKLKDRPRAIFCSSDYIAHGMVHALNKHGLTIPEDIEIITVSFNNIEDNIYIDSPILYLDIPVEKMAVECIRLVHNILEGNVTSPESIIVDTELV